MGLSVVFDVAGEIVLSNLELVVIGKHQALSCKVTCNFRLYFEIGRDKSKALSIHEKLPLSTHRSTL